jgi:hypothetical protein
MPKTPKKKQKAPFPAIIVNYKAKVEAQSVVGRWTSLFGKKKVKK